MSNDMQKGVYVRTLSSTMKRSRSVENDQRNRPWLCRVVLLLFKRKGLLKSREFGWLVISKELYMMTPSSRSKKWSSVPVVVVAYN